MNVKDIIGISSILRYKVVWGEIGLFDLMSNMVSRMDNKLGMSGTRDYSWYVILKYGTETHLQVENDKRNTLRNIIKDTFG